MLGLKLTHVNKRSLVWQRHATNTYTKGQPLYLFTVFLQEEFRNIGWTFLKTGVMMIGELDYGSHWVDPQEDEEIKMTATGTGISIFMYCLFLILMTILLMNMLVSTVYHKKYTRGFCFAVLCCGYTLTDFPISIRLTPLALWQSNDCPSASKATLMNMDKYFMWIHYERLHNHNKAKHNKPVCIFLGIYCKLNTQKGAVQYRISVRNSS